MVTRPDFDIKALYDAINEKRLSDRLSWTAVAWEINRNQKEGHPVATSTIKGLKTKAVVEGDGILQMLLWLHRTPESFIPGFEERETERDRLPEPGKGQVLRWDAKRLYSALDVQRQARGMSWTDIAQEIGGVTPGMLAHLAKGGRVGFPGVMRMVRWLGQPAALFTWVANR